MKCRAESRVHHKLYRRIKELELTYEELAERIGMSPAAFSRRMTGRASWTEPEMQKVLRLIGKPEETLSDLWPRREVIFNGRLRLK